MIDDRELGPRPPALAALLDAEHRAPRAPAVDRARVWAGVLAKLPPPGGPSDPPSGDPQPGGADGASGDAGSVAAAQTATTATTATTSALQAISLKTALLGVVVAVGLGAAIFVATRDASPPAPAPAPAPVQATPAPAVTPVEPPAHPAPIAPEPAPRATSTPLTPPRTTRATRYRPPTLAVAKCDARQTRRRNDGDAAGRRSRQVICRKPAGGSAQAGRG